MKNAKDSSVARALSILAWFGTDRPTANAPRLARELGIPKASLYRILNTLKEGGVVEYENDIKSYRLGPRVLQFARAYGESTTLVAIAAPYIKKLRDQTGETVCLSDVVGHQRICLFEAVSPFIIHWTNPPGTLRPLNAGSTGKVLLAFMNPSIYSELRLSMELKPVTPATATDWRKLEAQIEQIRRDGYCSSLGEVERGVIGLSVPVLGHDGYAVAAITVTAPLSRMSEQSIRSFIPLMKQYACAIGSEYGGAKM